MLITQYGPAYKARLARLIDVDVSTVRRAFNTKKPLPRLWIIAIGALLREGARGAAHD